MNFTRYEIYPFKDAKIEIKKPIETTTKFKKFFESFNFNHEDYVRSKLPSKTTNPKITT